MRVRPATPSPEANRAITVAVETKYEKARKSHVLRMALERLQKYMPVTWAIQNMFNCRRCGCLVTDRVLHDQFHAKYATKVVIVSEDYDLEGEYGRI